MKLPGSIKEPFSSVEELELGLQAFSAFGLVLVEIEDKACELEKAGNLPEETAKSFLAALKFLNLAAKALEMEILRFRLDGKEAPSGRNFSGMLCALEKKYS